MTCLTPVAETSICTFFLCHRLIRLIATIICSLDTVRVSCKDSCYTAQQTLFPSEWKCVLRIRVSLETDAPSPLHPGNFTN